MIFRTLLRILLVLSIVYTCGSRVSYASVHDLPYQFYFGIGIGPTYVLFIEANDRNDSHSIANGIGFELGVELGFRVSKSLVLYFDTRAIHVAELELSHLGAGNRSGGGFTPAEWALHIGAGLQYRFGISNVHLAISPGLSIVPYPWGGSGEGFSIRFSIGKDWQMNKTFLIGLELSNTYQVLKDTHNLYVTGSLVARIFK